MTLDQLPSTTDYAMTVPTSVIVFLVSAIATIALFVLLIIATRRGAPSQLIVTLFVGVAVFLPVGAFSMEVASEGLARFRAEAVSQHLDETYGIDVGFTEDGVQPTDLDGRTVHDGGAVYRITVATDGSILLVDEGGKEVPRVTR